MLWQNSDFDKTPHDGLPEPGDFGIYFFSGLPRPGPGLGTPGTWGPGARPVTWAPPEWARGPGALGYLGT